MLTLRRYTYLTPDNSYYQTNWTSKNFRQLFKNTLYLAVKVEYKKVKYQCKDCKYFDFFDFYVDYNDKQCLNIDTKYYLKNKDACFYCFDFEERKEKQNNV